MIDYTGFGEKVLTFKCTEKTKAGDLVKVCENDTVCPAADESFFGFVLSARNGIASVATEGFITVSYSGDVPAVGETAFAPDGQGGVTVSEQGKKVTVLRVDTVSNTVGFIF